MTQVTKRQYIDSVVAEIMANPKLTLGSHGLPTQLVGMIGTRPDILMKLAVIAFSTTDYKRGAKALRQSPEFKIFAYRKSADFVKNSIPDIASFQTALKGADADSFTSNGNVVGILALVDNPSGDVAEDMIALKSQSMPYSKLTDKAYASMGAMFITVCITNSFIRPADAMEAKTKATLNAKINERKTAAKIKAELMAKTKNKAKLEKVTEETKALENEAKLLKAEIDHTNKINKQLDLGGKSFKGSVAEKNAQKRTKLNALPLEDRKNLKLVLELFKQGKQEVALTLLKQYTSESQSKITEKEALDLLSYDEAFSHFQIYVKRYNGVIEELEELKKALTDKLSEDGTAKERSNIKARIATINKKIDAENAKLGVANDLLNGKKASDLMNNKLKMLEKLNARIAENKAKGLTLKNSLSNAVAELPISEPQKQAIQDQITESVLEGNSVEEATLEAIANNVDDNSVGVDQNELSLIYDQLIVGLSKYSLLIVDDYQEPFRNEIKQLMLDGKTSDEIVAEIVNEEVLETNDEDRYKTYYESTYYDNLANIDEVIDFKNNSDYKSTVFDGDKINEFINYYTENTGKVINNSIKKQIEYNFLKLHQNTENIGDKHYATPEEIVEFVQGNNAPFDLTYLLDGDKGFEWYEFAMHGIATDEVKEVVIQMVNDILSETNTTENATVDEIIEYFTKGDTAYDISDFDWFDKAVNWYATTTGKIVTEETKQELKTYLFGGFNIGDVVTNSETKAIGIVRDVFGKGDVRTDADGVVSGELLTVINDVVGDVEQERIILDSGFTIAPSTAEEIGWSAEIVTDNDGLKVGDTVKVSDEYKTINLPSLQNILDGTFVITSFVPNGYWHKGSPYDVRPYNVILNSDIDLEFSTKYFEIVEETNERDNDSNLQELAEKLATDCSWDVRDICFVYGLSMGKSGNIEFGQQISKLAVDEFGEGTEKTSFQLNKISNKLFIDCKENADEINNVCVQAIKEANFFEFANKIDILWDKEKLKTIPTMPTIEVGDVIANQLTNKVSVVESIDEMKILTDSDEISIFETVVIVDVNNFAEFVADGYEFSELAKQVFGIEDEFGGAPFEEGDIVADSISSTVSTVTGIGDDGEILTDTTMFSRNSYKDLSEVTLDNAIGFVENGYTFSPIAKTMLGMDDEPTEPSQDSIQDILSFL